VPKGIDGTEYDESWDLEDDSLESYVRNWVEFSSGMAATVSSAGPAQDLVHHTLRACPVIVPASVEIIHKMIEVPAWTKDGNKRDRPPSRAEIKTAMVKCGLHHLTKDCPQGIPSRMSRLLSGDVVSITRRNLDFTKSRAPSLTHRDVFQFHIPRNTSELILDLSEYLSLSNSSTCIACFLSAIAHSNEWLIPNHVFGGNWVADSESAISWFWSIIGTDWGLL
jgi:hypothetical protein